MRKLLCGMLVVSAALLLAPGASASEGAGTEGSVTAASNACGGVPELAAPDAQPAAIGQACGGAVCGKGTYCCNPTCSLCLPFGMSCTQQACLTDGSEIAAEPDADERVIFPFPTPCGDNFCGKGEFCCNASCGTCAPIGGACTDQYCPPVS